MYKILIKHPSEKNTHNTIWHSYGVITTTCSMSQRETKTFKEFETNDIEVLKATIKNLSKQYGFGDIRIVNDVTYSVLVDIAETSDECDHEIATPEDIENIYETAFNSVFS